MIFAEQGLETLQATADNKVLAYSKLLENTFLKVVSKRLYLDRLDRHKIAERKSPKHGRWRYGCYRAQVRRTAIALGKPTCCGEPRKLHPAAMRETVITMLVRMGL